MDFDLAFTPVTNSYPNAATGQYPVQSGDTLESIALSAYGDSSLWYLIADANGLSGDGDLRVGQIINIPTKVNGVHNNASTVTPYDASKIVGSTTPSLPAPQPKHGCGILGTIIMVIVAAVVTYFTLGAATGAVLAAFAAVGATGAVAAAAAVVVGAAITGALASIASQAVGDAIGQTKGFSWKEVGMSALTEVVTVGLGGAGAAADGVGGAASSGVTSEAASSFGEAVFRGAVSNAVTQEAAKVVGLQKNFSWRQVAGAGIGAGVGYEVGNLTQGLGENASGNFDVNSVGGFTSSAVTNLASNAATMEIDDRGHARFKDIFAQAAASTLTPYVEEGVTAGVGAVKGWLGIPAQTGTAKPATPIAPLIDLHTLYAQGDAAVEGFVNSIPSYLRTDDENADDQAKTDAQIEKNRFADVEADQKAAARVDEQSAQDDLIQRNRFGDIASDQWNAAVAAAKQRAANLFSLPQTYANLASTTQQDDVSAPSYTAQKGQGPLAIAQAINPDHPYAAMAYLAANGQITYNQQANRYITQEGTTYSADLSGFSDDQIAQLDRAGRQMTSHESSVDADRQAAVDLINQVQGNVTQAKAMGQAWSDANMPAIRAMVSSIPDPGQSGYIASGWENVKADAGAWWDGRATLSQATSMAWNGGLNDLVGGTGHLLAGYALGTLALASSETVVGGIFFGGLAFHQIDAGATEMTRFFTSGQGAPEQTIVDAGLKAVGASQSTVNIVDKGADLASVVVTLGMRPPTVFKYASAAEAADVVSEARNIAAAGGSSGAAPASASASTASEAASVSSDVSHVNVPSTASIGDATADLSFAKTGGTGGSSSVSAAGDAATVDISSNVRSIVNGVDAGGGVVPGVATVDAELESIGNLSKPHVPNEVEAPPTSSDPVVNDAPNVGAEPRARLPEPETPRVDNNVPAQQLNAAHEVPVGPQSPMAPVVSNPESTVIQVRTATQVNEEMLAADKHAAWGGSSVTTETVGAGNQFNMVVTEGQAQALMAGRPKFGGWATTDGIPSQAFARDDLAIIPSFKDDVSFAVRVETTAEQTINRGLVGPLEGASGGANQVEFVGSRNLKLVGDPQALPVGGTSDAGGLHMVQSDPFSVVTPNSGSDLVDIAKEAYARYSPELDSAKAFTSDLAGEDGVVSGRAKEPLSAANRLQRAIDNGWTGSINTPEAAIDNLWDALGTRVVFNNPTEATMGKFVDNLSNSIINGDVDVTKVNNLVGKGGLPYFTDSHLAQLQDAADSVGKSFDVRTTPYDSGYTAGMVYVKYPSGVRGEIQVMGTKVEDLSAAEHIPYDAFLNKPYEGGFPSEALPEVAAKLDPVRQVAQQLSEAQRVDYNSYLTQSYTSARQVEMGLPSSPVALPDGIPGVLSTTNLLDLNEQLTLLKGPK